jgi:hypothetical protein
LVGLKFNPSSIVNYFLFSLAEICKKVVQEMQNRISVEVGLATGFEEH